METRKIVLKESAVVLLGQVICVAVMLGVFALLGKFHISVLLGGIVGGILATANFFFMAVGASLAADQAESGDVKRGKALMQSSYTIRLVVLAVLLFACAKSGYFNLLSLVLPLAFTRPIITFGEFFRKSGETKK